MNVNKSLSIYQLFIKRRVFAALKAHWPEIDEVIDSPQLIIEEYK